MAIVEMLSSFLGRRISLLPETSCARSSDPAWSPTHYSALSAAAVTAGRKFLAPTLTEKLGSPVTSVLVGTTAFIGPCIQADRGPTYRALSSWCVSQHLKTTSRPPTSLQTCGRYPLVRAYHDCQSGDYRNRVSPGSRYLTSDLFNEKDRDSQYNEKRWYQAHGGTPLTTAAAAAAAAVAALTLRGRSKTEIDGPTCLSVFTHTHKYTCPHRSVSGSLSAYPASKESLPLQRDTRTSRDPSPLCRRLTSNTTTCPHLCHSKMPLGLKRQTHHGRGLLTEIPTLRKATAAPARCAASREGREVLLGRVSDFERGSLYELKIDDAGKDKVLLAHLGSGEFYCVGATCPHFSASLVKGVLTSEDRVVCPWHDAEFDVKTGKCANGPSLDGLPSFPVSVREGQVYAFVPNESLPQKQSPLYTQRISGSDGEQTFVIVGGGAAAAAAVETLRSEGFSGRVVLISKESTPPYDRTILSKNFLAKQENLLLRPHEYLERELGVELWLGANVEDVDFAEKTLSVRMQGSRGEKSLRFDKLLLCTGVEARSLSHLPNGNAKGIFTLRSLEDHQRIQKSLDEICKYNSQPRIVIIGSSFIGVESASAFKRRGFDHITILGKESEPLERVLGKRVGEGVRQLIASKGVKFLPHTGVKGFT